MTAFAVHEGFKVERLWQKILLGLLFVAPFILAAVVVGGLIFLDSYFSPIAVLFGGLAREGAACGWIYDGVCILPLYGGLSIWFPKPTIGLDQ